ncbi:MAG: DUF5916 domain-containing protein, partial [Terriglobia bacterium]
MVAQRASTPPVIDGSLEDEVWKDAPLQTGDFISYNPLYGEKQEQRTEVRVAYDNRNIYFSFHCYDSEPNRIRTTVSRRDNVRNDDWVGLSLDSGATGQLAYHMFVNPSGVQMDAFNASSSNEQFDVDWVWESAARMTSGGYIVEIRLPLQSIRFQGGAEVHMGILFWRRISRLGISAAWPDIPPGQWVFNRHAQLLFRDLEQPRTIELLPSATYSVRQTRLTEARWTDATHKGDLGLSAKLGIASTVTLDATINPDFSQVESDAFQVQVNQRFPIFFAEKRPFFMEGMSLFSLAGSGERNLRTAVHTRRIVNPLFGIKLTGTLGRTTFGLLSAADESPADISGRPEEIPRKDKLFTIGRAIYSLGESNYVGGIFADTEFAGQSNRVVGADLSLRFLRRQRFIATFLSTHTKRALEMGQRGVAGQIYYEYSKREAFFFAQAEHYAKGFQMDTAFYNRTGITGGSTYGELNHYPELGKYLGLIRISPYLYTKHYRDQVQNANEDYVQPGIRFDFTRQGFLRIDQGWGREPWANRRFKSGRRRVFGNAQILRWLWIDGEINTGWAIFYDPEEPFQGRLSRYRLELTFQPNSKWNEGFSYT